MQKITKIMKITPDMAKRCLEKNPNNRPIRPEWVKVLAEDMRTGNWRTTHQGIAFDEEGCLMDGQHRLRAILESGVTVEMEVTKGMKREDMIFVDNHNPRKFNNYSVFLGRPERHGDLAIARILEFGLRNRYPTLSIRDQFNLVEKYQDGITFAHSLKPSHKTRSAPVMAVIIRAFYAGISKTALQRFVLIVNTGEGFTNEESAAKKLRDLLLRIGHTNFFTREEIYCKTASALDNFLNHNKIEKLYARSPESLFVIPLRIKEGWK